MDIFKIRQCQNKKCKLAVSWIIYYHFCAKADDPTSSFESRFLGRPTGTTVMSKCDSDDQCQEIKQRKDKGLACQAAKDSQGLTNLPGKYCCISNDEPCKNSGECCNMDCEMITGECSGTRRIVKNIKPGLGLLSKCLRNEQCVGFPTRPGLSCQPSIGVHDEKLGNYCCIAEGSPCNPRAREDECCNAMGPRAFCSERRSICAVESA